MLQHERGPFVGGHRRAAAHGIQGMRCVRTITAGWLRERVNGTARRIVLRADDGVR